MAVPTLLKKTCRPFWDEIVGCDPVARLWRRDHTLWKPSPQEISNRLGWLDLPRTMRPATRELHQFAEEARQEGFRDVVLLGMGGSSLAAEVMRCTFGSRKNFPRLHVLDSTVPAWIHRVGRNIDPARTLFLVSSKSGSTIEVLSLYRHFRQLVQKAKGDEAGLNFIAITDEGSGLQRMATKQGFRRTFINPSDVGGRYSALSYFGLVPAALLGVNIAELLSRAAEMAKACEVDSPLEENPGALLGLVAGCSARAGSDKLTIITSPSLTSFGLWAEQLVAESTGKEGRGIIPIAQEPLGPVEVYGDDRVFICLRFAGDENEILDRHVDALKKSAHPALLIEIRDAHDLGAEFFRWELAIALAGACLQINPFDQPDVQESKDITKRVLSQYAEAGRLPELKDEGDLSGLLAQANPGDYIALMAFAGETSELNAAVVELRERILAKHRLPSTFGYGPRFLHSTGQLHKGGANNGLFVQFTCEPEPDIPIPGESYGFGVLASAQAIGDFDALQRHGRRVVRVHAGRQEDIAERVRAMGDCL